jgi:hypothetical protein
MARKKSTLGVYIVLLVLTIFAYQWPVAADANWTIVQSEDLLPAPLEQQLSEDEKTLHFGLPLLAVVYDPDPPETPRRILAPAWIRQLPEEAASANISITYVPNGGTDPWGQPCYTFPTAAKTAFNAAAHIWGNTLQSSVPITISACWADLGSSSTLGYSGGGPLHRDFSGALRPNTWYTASLANALHGSDLKASEFDMYITYNQNFNWYYGTDGNTPATHMDLMTVVMHEICHGLNFSGSMRFDSDTGTGSWGGGTGYPNIYDVFIKDGAGSSLIDYVSGSTALGTALTSENLWFHGSMAMAANGGQRVKMYAPSEWRSGSSYSHLDYDTFNNTSNQLMVWAVSAGESVHDPGLITKGLLRDIGWQAAAPPAQGKAMPWIPLLLFEDGGGTPTTTITITGLPTTDNDGNYTLQWSTSGLASTPWTIQEDSNTSFSNPTTYLSYDSSPPYTYNFTNKTDGTYCYRVGLSNSGPFSAPRCVTVNIPQTVATLRVVNNTRYDMIDIQLNGQQQLVYPYVISVGQHYDFEFDNPGTVSYYLAVGFYNTNGTRNPWFYLSGNTTVYDGQTTTITFNNPTIGQLLSGFNQGGRDWVGVYYCSSCPVYVNYAKFHFGYNGSWTLYDNNVYLNNGTVTLTSWPNYSNYVKFRLFPGDNEITLWYPFGTFYYSNGPPDWPTIEYVAQ